MLVSDGKGVARFLEVGVGEGWVLGLGRYLQRALYFGPVRLDGTVYSSRSGTSKHTFVPKNLISRVVLDTVEPLL